MESTWRMDKTCWFCSDFSACWCGKINIEVGCFIVGTCVAPWSVTVGLGQVVCGDGIYRARPPCQATGAPLAAPVAVLPAVL